MPTKIHFLPTTNFLSSLLNADCEKIVSTQKANFCGKTNASWGGGGDEVGWGVRAGGGGGGKVCVGWPKGGWEGKEGEG